MKTYLFTVPQKFRTQAHPLDVGPEDLMSIEAESYIDARQRMIDIMGNDTWVSPMLAGAQETDDLIAKYYPGKIVPVLS